MRKRKREVYRRDDVKLGWMRNRDGEAVAVAEYRDAGGKRRRPALGTNLSEAEARAALDRFADARLAVTAQQTKRTVGDLWRLWLEYRARDKFSNAIYEANWVSLAPHFANRVPLLLTDKDWRDYAQSRFSIGRSPWTVHTELSRLKACLMWAVKTHHLERMPIFWIPSRGEHRDRVLSIEEMQALITAAGDPHIHLFIVLAFATGARHTAILDLTWDRVDFIKGTIQYDTNELKDPMSRSWKKGRATVLMGARIRAELEQAKMAAQSEHVIEHGGRRLKTIRQGFENAVRRAGLPDDVTPHTIRHTVATWLKERGIGLEARAQLLGHADSRTTDLVYSHTGADYLSGAVTALDHELAALPQRRRPTRVVESNKTDKTGP